MSYLLSIWLAKRTVIELGKSAQQSEKTKDIQRQFSRTLFAQVSLCNKIPNFVFRTFLAVINRIQQKL
jgi:hypothetical protein